MRRSPRTRWIVVAALGVAGVVAVAWRAPAEPNAAARSAMEIALEKIGARTPDENRYTGSAEARRLRKQLAALPTGATAQERFALLADLGRAELRLGNMDRAVSLYTEGRRLMARAKLPTAWRARFHYDEGLAWLLLGERQNCCAAHVPESCVLPIQGKAVHRYRRGGERAAECFEHVTRLLPPSDDRHQSAVWLLNVAHMVLGSWPDGVPAALRLPPRVLESDIPFPRFANVAQRLGLDAFDLAGGVCIDDFDNDGDLDILTSCWDPLGPMHYFRNEGDGTFIEQTREAGLDHLRGGLNLKQADYDNDGDLDVLVLRGAWLFERGTHPNSLLRNDGTGRFEDVTFASGLGARHLPTQTAEWADYDLDGDLDLYVGNESLHGFQGPCQLFQNQGDGTFVDVAERALVQNLRFTKGVTWGDYDDDGDPDLYVSNLMQPNRLYRNEGDGTFTDMAPTLDVAGPDFSFPVWFWDFDNDGSLDLYVPSYAAKTHDLPGFYRGEPTDAEPSRLYRGDGQGRFEDVARSRGLLHPVNPMGSNFGDLNGDGFLDFYLGTGDPELDSVMPNLMFVNQAGQRFADVTVAGGFGHLQKGHGIAFADLDHDGDLDVFSQLGGAYIGDRFHNALYENPGFGTRWLCLKLEGTRSNRCAIGARIHVVVDTPEGPRSIYRHVNSGGSFGANPLRQTLGLGQATRIVSVEVRWPGGATQTFSSMPLDRAFRLVEGQAAPQPMAYPRTAFASGS